MKKGRHFRYFRPFLYFVIVLAISWALLIYLLMTKQKEVMTAEASAHAQHEISIVGAMIREYLIKKDYATVENFLTEWGMKDKEAVEVKAIAPNGFVLAEFTRRTPVLHSITTEENIQYSDTDYIVLKIVKSLDHIDESLRSMILNIFVISLLFTGGLGFILWSTLKKTAFIPMESMIEQIDEMNKNLEERVKEHTTQLISSELKYRDIFQNTAVSLWEEDFTAIGNVLEELRAEGITDFKKYFDEHPDFIRQAVTMIRVKDVNDATLRLYGAKSKEELLEGLEKIYTPDSYTVFKELLLAIVEGRDYFESRAINKDLQGNELIVFMNVSIPSKTSEIKNMLVSVIDVTSHRRLEEQLNQARKMESVGRLAGGVAHDFNNILSAIIGYTELALMNIERDDPLRKNLRIIYESGQRAANLTQQLLAFSRKQLIKPEIINVNRLLDNLKKLLDMLIGEDIGIKIMKGENLWTVNMDQTQVEQIIMNLAANARDAMIGGGELIIETGNVFLKGELRYIRPEGVTGEFVMISVSDTGHGIDEELTPHIYEPFFTSKEPGKGTGLGLSTVYGIVKQNEGYIDMHSEPDKGTTFKVYLRRAEVSTGGVEEEHSIHLIGGVETILLAEDEGNVRSLASTILTELGYTVFEARDGEEALQFSREHKGNIDLLLTDVIMPKISGSELADRIRKSRPSIKIIYISGYTESDIAHHGVLKDGVHFLQKPINTQILSKTIREVLDTV